LLLGQAWAPGSPVHPDPDEKFRIPISRADQDEKYNICVGILL